MGLGQDRRRAKACFKRKRLAQTSAAQSESESGVAVLSIVNLDETKAKMTAAIQLTKGKT